MNYIDRPTRTYAAAVCDQCEAEATRRNVCPGLTFISVTERQLISGTGTYEDFESFETFDECALHAAETVGYKYTIQIRDGVARVLHMRRHGEGIQSEIERDDECEDRHRAGLAGYGRP